MSSELWKRIPALYQEHGSLQAIARNEELHYTTVNRAYQKAIAQGIMEHVELGRKSNTHQKTVQRIKSRKTFKANSRAYILTSAQNNTHVHEATWENLQVLAKHYGAEIMVSTFLYANRSHWQKNLDKAQPRLKKGEREKNELWFDPAILPYVNNDRVEIAPGLVWCGEMNISPTAAAPLSGLSVYTGRESMIVGATKLAMESVATLGGSGTKFNYSTGTVTQRNYIQRKEGLKAEFHHSYGGLIVELDDDDNWWVRQLNADSDGTIHDLDIKVSGGKLTKGNRVEAITFGDIHLDQIDKAVEEATWGKGGMVDTLRPRFQFFHDILNFARRSHHNIKDPYSQLEFYAQKRDSVRAEVQQIIDWLRTTAFRDYCQSIVVPSNHDEHISKWMSTVDGRFDPVNAEFWGKVNDWLTSYIMANGHRPPSLLAFITEMMDPALNDAANVAWLDRDTSFVICPDFGGGIECALHFDQGANGSRGSLAQFARMGRRSNGGHSHTTGINGGAYQGGLKAEMFLGYNHGLSSWSWSDIITHENSKRQIVTFFKKADGKAKWRAK